MYRLTFPERTLIMGVLNVTPDSFSNGGLYLDPEQAALRAVQMQQEGADIIDIGAESTRPDSGRISEEEELQRLMPVLQKLAGRLAVPISIDTYKPAVAERAVAAGAQIINCVALGDVRQMAEVAARAAVPLVLMHIRGTPETMKRLPPVEDVVGEVREGLRALRDAAVAAGVIREQLILDPGFGFGKNGDENYRLLAGFAALHELGCPLLAGTSRKAFIGRVLGVPESERAWGTAATVTAAILAGAQIVRVHDIAEMVQVARVADQIARARFSAC